MFIERIPRSRVGYSPPAQLKELAKGLFVADDWGFSPAINAGILCLAKKGWVRSVSCVANAPHLLSGLDELLAIAGLKFSLHFNLTYGRPLLALNRLTLSDGEFRSLRWLIGRAYGKALPGTEITEELEAQLQRLLDVHIPVCGIDGHHHIHLLPGIADSVQNLVERHGLKRIRVMNDRQHLFSYGQSQLFQRRWCRSGMRVHFEPCYYLRPANLFDRAAFIQKCRTHAPLLVHPALMDDFARTGMVDCLREQRVFELRQILRFLESE